MDERTHTHYTSCLPSNAAKSDQPTLYFKIFSKIPNAAQRQLINSAIDIVAITGIASLFEAWVCGKIPFYQLINSNESFINSYKNEVAEAVKSHLLRELIISFSTSLVWSKVMSDREINDLLQLSLNPEVLVEIKAIHQVFFQKTPLIGDRICEELYFPNACLKPKSYSKQDHTSNKKAKYLTDYVKTLIPKSLLNLDNHNDVEGNLSKQSVEEPNEENNQRIGTIKFLIHILNSNPAEKILQVSSSASLNNDPTHKDPANLDVKNNTPQKTLISRSIASVGAAIRRDEKAFWLDAKHLYLGRLIFWQRAYSNCKDNKLIQELRNIQHTSRNTKKNNCFDDWAGTITKYCSLMEQELESSDLDKIVPFKRLQSIKKDLQKYKMPVPKHLQEEINRHIDHLMDAWSDLRQEKERIIFL